ncbi:vascular cell adhesion protein 1 [Garra rufa]|uniref:vascular cell adhesion protein 1 n=1 Tax=Garra rufa TaxID=137080 RepID=UPI003CCEF8A0
MLLLQPLISILLISLAHGDSCPIVFSPLDVVVKYGDSFSVNCSSSITTHQFFLSWEGFDDKTENTEETITSVTQVTDWEKNVTCYMFSNETQCSQDLPITIYKTPDNVSISIVNHSEPMMEGVQYELQCDVYNVAPVQDFTVKWYNGQTLLDEITFNDTSKTPVNAVTTLLIRPNRTDDGARYRCEAKLDLGEEGPQPPPTVTSEPLSVEVYYEPKHSSSTEIIVKNKEVTLDCTVKANPAPTYTWHSEHLNEQMSSSKLPSSTLSPGKYTCTAENSLGSASKVFIVSDNQCPVQIIPRRVVVEFGGSVAVNCTATVQHYGMGWEASEGGVDKTSASVITWSVSNLTEWDIEPFCYINYDKSQAKPCEEKLPVIIYKTPDSVSISIVNHSGPMMEGKQYELQCDVKDVAPVQYLTVKWYKGQTLLDQTTFTDTIKTPVNEMATLLIRPDRDDDGAQYRCKAELDLGEEEPQPPPKTSSDALSITVYYAPEIQSCKDWSPLRGTSLDSHPLNVYSVVGNPHPNISWSLSSSPVSSSRNLTENDSGQYEITASNVRGHSSCFINISVEYPPELNCNKNYEVEEKTLFQPPCVADGLPKPELSLYKNGKIIQHEFLPSWNDSGLYRLTAHNKHGTVNSVLTINILHAPVFHASQEKFVAGEDSDITLECSSSGNPEPEMWWSFKNKNISTGRRHIALNIGRATSTNAGVYTCSATNKFGRNDKSFVVEIRDDSPNYIIIVVVVFLVLLIIIILVVIFLWKRNKSRGHYKIQSANQYEMRPLSNGGPK